MAVTITDNRTLIDEADSLTDWSSPVAAESLELFTADPNPVESTASIGMPVSIETSDIVHAISSADLTSMLVYVWVNAAGVMDTIANGGVALILGDVDDLVGYHLAGSDVAAFRHEAGPIAWQCLVLDTSALPSAKTQLAGAADPTLTAITRVGAMYKTLSKALGGASNCFTDIIRYGNGGLIITGGGEATEGNFSEIATEDRSSTSQKAYGICRKLGAGLFGLQGPLTFGDDGGTGSVDFLSTNEVIVFEDRDLGTTKYYINVKGNATGNTSFQLGSQVGSTTMGKDGTSLICPPGVGAKLDAADADVEYVLLYGSLIKGFNNGVLFSIDATNGPNHKIYDTVFIGCGQIDPGKVQFKNNSIANSTDGATGALLLDGDFLESRMGDLSFTSAGTGHAIYITATGTYQLNNFTYTGYGADDTSDAVIYNNSEGEVTIGVSGGDTPTVRDGSGATTTVNSPVDLTVTVVDAGNNAIFEAQVAIFKTSDPVNWIMNEDTNVDGVATESFNYPGSDVEIYVRVRKSSIGATKYIPNSTTGTITSGGFSVKITLQEDPNV